MYFLIRVSCILTVIQMRHHMMLVALGMSMRFEKAGQAQRWMPSNPSHWGCSGEPKKAYRNTPSCPSSSLVRINFVPFLMQPLLLQSYKISQNFGNAYFFKWVQCSPCSKWLPLFLMFLFKATVCGSNHTVYNAVLYSLFSKFLHVRRNPPM